MKQCSNAKIRWRKQTNKKKTRDAAWLSAIICHVAQRSSQLAACLLLLLPAAFSRALGSRLLSYSLFVIPPSFFSPSFHSLPSLLRDHSITLHRLTFKAGQDSNRVPLQRGKARLISGAGSVRGPLGQLPLTARRLIVEIFPRRNSAGQHEQ